MRSELFESELFEEAWKQNRHEWESTRCLAQAMYLAGEQDQQSKVYELQKRLDELELTIKGAVTFVDLQIEAVEQGREAAIGTQAKNWWSSKLLILRPIRRVLEQALKGGDQNTEKQPNKHAENIATKGVKGGDQ